MTRHDLNRRLAEQRRTPSAPMRTITQIKQSVTPLFYYVQPVGNKFRIYVSETGCYEGRLCTAFTLPHGNWFATYHEAEAALLVAMVQE